MIRIEISEQTAAELHRLVVDVRALIAKRDPEHAALDDLRGAELALSGGLRAAGWTPTDGGWEQRPTRSRR